ncbi:MAG: signal peptidase I [Sulfuricaulis sp.]
MDFALIMLLILVGTGTLWGFDRWLWAAGRERRAKALTEAGKAEEAVLARKEPIYVEYARAFFPVILIVFFIRSFLVEPFRIPSGSMLPSLYIGDFILVNKFSYGVRLPVANNKILEAGQPKRGEVAVFRFPGNPSINYIKRVVGIPGDRILYKDKKLYINGTLMEQADTRPYFFASGGDAQGEALRLTENLDGAKHDILTTNRLDPPLPEIVVPEGKYFVMGDNRDHSNDSRYWGFVPDQNLVGKAFLIWFSWDMTGQDKWFWERVVWNRIGNSIY